MTRRGEVSFGDFDELGFDFISGLRGSLLQGLFFWVDLRTPMWGGFLWRYLRFRVLGAVDRRHWRGCRCICYNLNWVFFNYFPGGIFLFQLNQGLHSRDCHFFNFRRWSCFAVIGFSPESLTESNEVEISGGRLVIELVQDVLESD